MPKNEKVLVAMSGGVDSSVAAALLLQEGYQVRGLYLIPWHASAIGFERIGNPDDAVESAQQVADQLGIILDVLPLQKEFYDQVIAYFVSGYRIGNTPNPCFMCNKIFKWVAFANHADSIGYEYISSGHYAQLIRQSSGKMRLLQAVDKSKDQSYVLSWLGQDVLQRVLLPLGKMQKSEVREIAASMGIVSAHRSDSQDMCFVQNSEHKALVQTLLGADSSKSGSIVDTHGNVLGTHEGLENYTYGQRKGIRIAAPDAYYVLGKNLAENQLIVGQKTLQRDSVLLATQIHWVLETPPDEVFEAQVKIRYQSKALPACIRVLKGDQVEIKFNEPVLGITPGQFAVIYQENEVIGAGEIQKEIIRK